MIEALISAGGSVLGNLLGGIFGLSSTNSANEQAAANIRAQNEANLKLAEKQNAFNYGMWKLNNEYNSPLSQVRRLRQAGLSAAAAASAVSGNSSQPIQSANLANQNAEPRPMVPDYSFIGQNFIGVARELAALKKEKAEASMAENELEMQPRLLLSDWQIKNTAWRLASQTLHEQVQTFGIRQHGKWLNNKAQEVYIDYQKALTYKANADTKLAGQQFEFLEKKNPEEINNLIASTARILSERDVNVKKLDQMDADIANKASSTALNYSLKNQADATTENLGKQGQVLDENIKQESYVTKLKELEKLYQQFGAPETVSQRIAVMLLTKQISTDQLDGYLFDIKNYLHRGHLRLGNDPITENFVNEVLNEGNASAGSRNAAQAGFWTNIFNGVHTGGRAPR